MATTNKEIMTAARNTLRGNWGLAIGTSVIYLVIIMASSSIPRVGAMINLVIAGPLNVGLCIFFLSLIRKNNPEIKNLFDGFSSFANSLAAYLLVALFTLLWMLLLIVPGIIASLSYSLTLYILADNPNIDAMAAIRKSKAMMMGNKAKLFCLYGRFFGWFMLGLLTLGIGFLWIFPYFMTSMANFYEDLKENQIPASTATQTGTV
jgi:uncharacterized membrane protein